MTYQKTIEYLYKQMPAYQKIGSSAYKEGLDNSLALDKLFSSPHRKYKTIHVAGTNGKGSTSHLLAAILQQSGYKVGLYTSPHLIDFRERIRIDGKMISEQYIIDFVAKNRKEFEPIEPSFFELTMMMAFKYFADQEVDIAIIEVGLGGRLDSTNIITPDLCVITNISKDHVQILGDTLDEIALQKAGIIKKDIPVVIGEAKGEIKLIFKSIATWTGAPIVFAEDEHLIQSSIKTASGWLFDTKNFAQVKCALAGFAQVKNAATVLCAITELQKLGYDVSTIAVQNGFAYVCELTGLMGRWQVIQNNPKLICDTAHNVGGMQYIAEQLAKERYKKLHFVVGMVDDKDISSVLDLLPKSAVYYFTRASIPRALDENELMQQASEKGLQGSSYATVADAIHAAKKAAANNDLIFIGGSTFVVADALEILL